MSGKQHSEEYENHKQSMIAKVAVLIAEKGIADLTMRNIANHVGCSVGTLPHYFSGKEDIVTAALNWSNERILSRIDGMPTHEISLDSMVPLVLASFPLDEQSDMEWRVRLAFWDYAATHSELLEALTSVKNEAMAVLGGIIAFLQEKGEIKADRDPEVMGQTIYHLSTGLGFNLLHLPISGREQGLEPMIEYINSLRA